MKTYTLKQAADQMNKVCDGLGDLFLKRVDENYYIKFRLKKELIHKHLIRSFEWLESKEGHQFWEDIYTMFYEFEKGI